MTTHCLWCNSLLISKLSGSKPIFCSIQCAKKRRTFVLSLSDTENFERAINKEGYFKKIEEKEDMVIFNKIIPKQKIFWIDLNAPRFMPLNFEGNDIASIKIKKVKNIF